MNFLFKNATAARGVQVTPSNLSFIFVLLCATIGAFVVAQKFSELYIFFSIPPIAMIMVLNIPSFPPKVQTAIGIISVLVAAWLLYAVLDTEGVAYQIQGMSTEGWYKFRTCVVALPCLCILLRIVGVNPSRINILLFSIPMVVCAGISVYALRVILE
ncbi:hypothetical protein [Haliscomenobacter sp.]|uniref:hypothetical protein n=1 Tax=Haliscomenobacter sp. TaxID=2717303 RepID=UPI003364FC3F